MKILSKVKSKITHLFHLPRQQKPLVRSARKWSNRELERLAPLFSGEIINVSAWKDEDKEGRHYVDYFTSASSYVVSNYAGWRGINDISTSDIVLDLEAELAPQYKYRFDVVFNHTTLEHIFEVRQAFANLCTLTRDAVILVVPFVQHLHGPEDGDFWRFTPYCIRRLFKENGLKVIYESTSPPNGILYLFYVASRDPEQWKGILREASNQDKTLGQEIFIRLLKP